VGSASYHNIQPILANRKLLKQSDWAEILTELTEADWSNFLGNQYITWALTRFQQADVVTLADVNEIENQTPNNPLNSLMTIYSANRPNYTSAHVQLRTHAHT
jgi:hypothetical protein